MLLISLQIFLLPYSLCFFWEPSYIYSGQYLIQFTDCWCFLIYFAFFFFLSFSLENFSLGLSSSSPISSSIVFSLLLNPSNEFPIPIDLFLFLVFNLGLFNRFCWNSSSVHTHCPPFPLDFSPISFIILSCLVLLILGSSPSLPLLIISYLTTCHVILLLQKSHSFLLCPTYCV